MQIQFDLQISTPDILPRYAGECAEQLTYNVIYFCIICNRIRVKQPEVSSAVG